MTRYLIAEVGSVHYNYFVQALDTMGYDYHSEYDNHEGYKIYSYDIRAIPFIQGLRYGIINKPTPWAGR